METKLDADKSMVGSFIDTEGKKTTNNFLPLLSFEVYETDQQNIYLVIDKVKFESSTQKDFFLDVVNDPTIKGAGQTVSLGYYGIRVEMLNSEVTTFKGKSAIKCYSSDYKLVALVRQV